MTKITGRTGSEVNQLQTHTPMKTATSSQKKKISTRGSTAEAAPPERIGSAKGRAVQGERFSFRGYLVWQGIRPEQSAMAPDGVRDSSGVGAYSVRHDWSGIPGRAGISSTDTFREHYDRAGHVLGWSQEEVFEHANGNIISRGRWHEAGDPGWGPWRVWVSGQNENGTYETTGFVQRGGKYEVVPSARKARADDEVDTSTAADTKDGGKKPRAAGGYGADGSTGDPRAGEAAIGTPGALPGDDLVLVLKNLGLGVLARDLVWNPDPETAAGGDSVHEMRRTSYGPGGRPEGPAGSTGSPSSSLPINKDDLVTDPPLTEDLKRNPGRD